MSFQNFGLLGSKGYIGLENYRKLFADPFFYQTIWNTLIVTVGIVAASVLIPIIIAIALDNLLLQKVKKFVQTTIYVPFLFSALIIIGIYINLLSPV